MRLRYRLLILSGLLGSLLLWLHFKHPIKGVVIPSLAPTTATLNLLNHPLPDFGHGTIYKKVGNTVVASPKVTGFPFDIGIAGAFGGGMQVYLTTEIFFYRHFELLGGVGGQYGLRYPVAMLAVGYRLPYKRLDNISLFTGINTQTNIIVGAYIRFGSN